MSENRIARLFNSDLNVINMGLESFGENLRKEGVEVTQMNWHPPDEEMQALLDRIVDGEGNYIANVQEANQRAVDVLLKAQPVIKDVGVAGQVIPGMSRTTVLHAGPPISYERMCGPMRGGVMGGLIYEGLARDRREAEELAVSGEVNLEPCHHHDTVGPMAGVVTFSMPVWIVENAAFGNRAYCTLNEGLGKVLRYGAFSEEVILRLRWMADVLAPVLREALLSHGSVDLNTLMAQALQMGDEGHNRNRAGTSLLIRELSSHLVQCGVDREAISEVFRFLDGNDHFFLNLTMPACKCALDPASEIPGSSMISAMSRNGTEFGIRVSGLGKTWFTAPAPMVDGLYLPGYSSQDASPDIGDSVITETAGLGGFAMAAAPAIVKFVGGSPADALNFTRRMYEITLAESRAFQIPALDFRGTPTGIDLLKVARSGILPAINTGIAHREPGVGMVGAGLVRPPMECFRKAAKAFVERYAR